MLILALETSGFGGSIALMNDRELLGERCLDARRRHAQTLIPEVQSLLRENQKSTADCTLLAVSCGPGSFTGLRVGIACAKVLAYATGIAIAAVPTFSGIVAGCPQELTKVNVILNAQREELFIGSYLKSDAGTWVESRPLRIERADRWLLTLKADDVVTGPALEQIEVDVARKCLTLPVEFWQPRAYCIGQVGLKLANAGMTTTCWELAPYYVRKSAAEEKWDAKLGTA